MVIEDRAPSKTFSDSCLAEEERLKGYQFNPDTAKTSFEECRNKISVLNEQTYPPGLLDRLLDAPKVKIGNHVMHTTRGAGTVTKVGRDPDGKINMKGITIAFVDSLPYEITWATFIKEVVFNEVSFPERLEDV